MACDRLKSYNSKHESLFGPQYVSVSGVSSSVGSRGLRTSIPLASNFYSMVTVDRMGQKYSSILQLAQHGHPGYVKAIVTLSRYKYLAIESCYYFVSSIKHYFFRFHGLSSALHLKMKVLPSLLSLALFSTAYAAPTSKATYASNQSAHSAGVAQAGLEKRVTASQCTSVAKAVWARASLEVAYVLTMLNFVNLQLHVHQF